MQCPQCHHDNRAERRFCAECGAALATRCTVCGASNEPGEKFYGGCGAALGGTAASAQSRTRRASPAARIGVTAAVSPHEVPDGERKTVTALFADTKGSMELLACARTWSRACRNRPGNRSPPLDFEAVAGLPCNSVLSAGYASACEFDRRNFL